MSRFGRKIMFDHKELFFYTKKNLQSNLCHDFKVNFLHFYFLKYWPICVTKMINNSAPDQHNFMFLVLC